MAKYTGNIDDYLRATDNTVEFASTTRVLVIYDPDAMESTALRIDVSERGAKDVDKLVKKTNAAIIAAQEELRRAVGKIKSDGGGTAVSARALKKELNPAKSNNEAAPPAGDATSRSEAVPARQGAPEPSYAQ